MDTIEIKSLTATLEQVLAALQPPSKIDLDVLMTPEEFAAWTKTPLETVLRKLPAMPGVVERRGKYARIHPRTYLELSLRRR